MAMTQTEKRERAAAKKQASLTIIGRATFKATGAVLFGIASHNAKTGETKVYHVTVIAGAVRGCHDAATGETCEGRHFAGHCCHGDRAMQYEAARAQELAEAAQVAPAILGEMVQDLEQHIDETLSEVLVFMDPIGRFQDFGTVLISGEPSQYLWIEEIRKQYPIHRVIDIDEYMAFKQREAEKYRAQFPGDFADVA